MYSSKVRRDKAEASSQQKFRELTTTFDWRAIQLHERSYYKNSKSCPSFHQTLCTIYEEDEVDSTMEETPLSPLIIKSPDLSLINSSVSSSGQTPSPESRSIRTAILEGVRAVGLRISKARKSFSRSK